MSSTRERGAQVEAAARDHLRAAGLREVAANADYRRGELDLVMFDPGDGGPDRGAGRDATLVFVEVRHRSGRGFGGGAASVDWRKRRRIATAARIFLARHPRMALLPCRFDVVDASGDPGAPVLDWIRGAFTLDDC